MATFVSAFLPLLALLALLAAPASAQTFYSYCYFQQNTLATSPYLPWSVYSAGTFSINVNTAAQTGVVTAVTGFREVYVQGKALQTNQILGVNAPDVYGSNDNLLSLVSPYLKPGHAVSFYLDGIAQFAAGPAVYRGFLTGSANVSIEAFSEYRDDSGALITNALAESDNPPNDGTINVIASGFQMAATSTFINSYAGCTLTRPTAPSIPAATLAAYNAPMTWPMCYQFQSGASNVGANAYITTVTGVFTTTGYQGTSPTGQLTGYLATGVNGTRNWTVASNRIDRVTTSYIISLVAIGSPLSPYINFALYNSTSTTRRFTDNILFPTFPQIDSWGIALIANASVLDIYTATGVATGSPGTLITNAQSNTTDFVLYTDGSYLVYDVVYSRGAATGALVQNHNWADTLNVQTQAQYNALVPSVYKTQAAWTTGVCGNDYTPNPTRYNFCWYVDNSNASIPAQFQGVSYIYGVMTAKTGLVRYGQPAMQLQGMTGIRTVLNTRTNQAMSYSLVQLEAPNGLYETFLSQGYFWLTDNVLFTAAPWFSEAGLALTFARFSNSSYPAAQASSTNYMNLYSTWGVGNGPFGLTEYAVGDTSFPYTPFFPNQSLSSFNYTPFAAGQVASCGLTNNKVSEEVVAFSFCWFRQSGTAAASGYLNQISATIYAYNTPVYYKGRPGYVIQTMVGNRVYADIHGFVQSDVITGLDGDSLATSFGGFDAVFSGGAFAPNDNLIFDSAPYLTAGGLLYQVNGLLADYVLTQSATVAGNGYALTSVGNLWYDEGGAVFGGSAPYNYYDQSLYNITSGTTAGNGLTWEYIDLTASYSNVKVIRDNGASAAAGTALQQCNQPAFLLYAISYSLTQNLPNSPYLPWSVYVTAMINVSSVSGQYWPNGPGFQVVGMKGTRTIQYGGQTITNNIIGVAPRATWNWNDNSINLGTPFLSSVHVLTYQLDGPAYFPGGAIPGVTGVNATYVTLVNFTGAFATYGSGLTEFDAGLNDGAIQNITSAFDIRLCPAYNNASLCGYVSPLPFTTLTWDSAALAAYNTRSQVSMCFSVTAGPGGYGNINRGYYQTVVTAILTVTGWGTVNGRAAYLIVGGTGTRTYYYPDGVTNSTVSIQVAGLNAAIHAFPNYFLTSGWASYASNNVYYPTWPQLDARGIQWIGASDFFDSQEGDYHSNVDRISWSGSDWREYNTDFSLLARSAVTFPNYGGNAVFAATTGSQDMTSSGQQCTLSWGTPSTISFCYWLNNTGASNGYFSYAHGLMNVAGPQNRLNRQALAVQGMTGVRGIQFNNGSLFTQNIINVEYVDEDTFNIGSAGYVWLTDNLVFPSGVPEVSLLGISYSTSTPPIMPAGAGGADIIISTDGLSSGNAFYEAVGNENFDIYSQSYMFKSQAYNPASPSLVSCQSSQLPAMPAPPALQSYDFCYATNGPMNCGFQIVSSGTITVFNTPVTVLGRTGYPMANISGTRVYTDGQGFSFTATITGLSEDWQAAQNGFVYDQLFFPTSAPAVDSMGLLYKYSGSVNGNGATPFTFDRVVRLFSNTTYPAGMEEVWYLQNATAAYTPRINAQNAVIKTGATGSVAASTCSASLGPTGFTGVCTASTGGATPYTPGGGSSSSSLSGGQIAGIVVGTVIGAALFCVLCFCIGMYGFGGKRKDGEKSTSHSAYSNQQDISKVGQSQVEMQSAHGDTVEEGV